MFYGDILTTPKDPFSLAGWRREVAELYAALRNSPALDPGQAATDMRSARDRMFLTHPDTPLSSDQLSKFTHLSYYPYDPRWRVLGVVERNPSTNTDEVNLQADGLMRFTRVGHVRFQVLSHIAQLDIFWIEGYGGGLFLPFRDATNGQETYEGGRYLLDTIKGADLGAEADQLILDFNYAYNPSCGYSDRWVCPLAPPKNRLSFRVEAGEQAFQ